MTEKRISENWDFSEEFCKSMNFEQPTKKMNCKNPLLELNINGIKSKTVKIGIDCHDDISVKTEIYKD